MDYFLSSGTTTTWIASTLDAISTGITQPIDVVLPSVSVSSSVLDSLHQFIPAEILSLVNLPLLWIMFIRVLVIIWVLKDSVYRSSNRFFPIFSLLLVTIVTPVIWLPIYLAIRPIGYKHERAYWKRIMQEYKMNDWNNILEEYTIADDTIYGEDFIQAEDEQHLAELRKQATLASRRAKKIVTKKPITKTTVKKTPTKPVARKIPTAKKAVTRTAK